MSSNLFLQLSKCIELLNIEEISDKRRDILDELTTYIQTRTDKNESIRLNFICTHNSRRSHMAQVWAQALSFYFGVKNVSCYSGGTEATALFPMAAESLRNAGFEIQSLSENENPIYSIKYASEEHSIIGFSKKFDHPFNPKSNFAAIMTCNSADEACPIVSGADARIPITYEDPKKFDNTPLQSDKYNERSNQIATELFYVFSRIK